MPKITDIMPTGWAVTLECGHEIQMQTRPDPRSEVHCNICAEVEHKEIDDALRGVTCELKRRGVKAEYHHSGGGCMTVHIEIAPAFTWDFGLADVCWGGDFSADNAGHLLSVESPYPAHTRYETVADWIWSLLSLPPFLDLVSGSLIQNAYYDPTLRFSVNPWETYGLPFPSSIQGYGNMVRCDNCTEYCYPVLNNKLCTFCQQPDMN